MKNVAHSPKMLNKWRLQLMQSTESVHFFIAKHPKANWVISIIFFCILILNSSLTFLSHKNKTISWNQRNITGIDLCFYIVSLLPGMPKKNDISAAQAFAIFDSALIILFICLIFINDSIKMPFLIICFSIIMGYLIPLFFLHFTNIFNQSYIFFQNDINASTSLCMIFHAIYILSLAIFALFNSSFPVEINLPFYAQTFIDSIFLHSYYGLFSIFNMSHQSTYLYIRGSISLIYSILIIFKPPYFNRKMNFLLLICSLYDMSSSYCANFYDYECFSCLAGSIFLSFIIYYGFYYIPRRYKNDIDKLFHYSFINKDEEAALILNNIKLDKEIKRQYFNLIRYALKYKTQNASEIISYFQKYQRNLKDIFFCWSAENALKIKNDEFIDQDIQIITDLSKDSDQYYNEFWHRVWLSDTTSLIKLSAKLGSLHMKKVMYGIHNYKKNPKILDLYDDDMKIVLKKRINSNKFTELFKKFSKFDIFLFFSFILFIAIHIYLITIRSRLFPIFKSYCLFGQLELKIISLHSFYVINNSNPIESSWISNLRDSVKEFASSTKNVKLNRELIHETQLFQKLNDSLLCLEKNNYVNFLTNCYNSSKKLLDELVMINNNKSIVLSTEGRPDKTSIFTIGTITIFLIIFCIIFIIISLSSISNRITKYIQNFLLIPKSRVVQLAIFDQSIEIFNEMPSRWAEINPIKHLPWTIFTHVVFALFFVLLCLSIDLNFRMTGSQSSHVYNVMSRMSLAIQVPIYVTLDYEAEINGDNNTVRESEERIVQIVEMLHDEQMNDYLKLIPSDIYTITFFSIQSAPIHSPNILFYNLLNNITCSMDNNINDEAYFHRCCLMSVIFIFYMVCLSYILSIFMMHGITRMMDAELKMPEILYRLAKSNSFLHSIQKIKRHLINSFNSLGISDNSGKSIISIDKNNNNIKLNEEQNENEANNDPNLEDENSFIENSSIISNIKDDIFFELAKNNENTLNFSSIPIILFVIDSNSIVIFSTKTAQNELGLKVGKLFTNGTIDVSVVSSIQRQLELFLENHDSPSHIIIPTEKEDRSIIMKASYFYSNKKIKLNDVTICFDSVQFKAEKIERKIRKIFYREYPNFIPLDSVFPLELKPKLKSFIIIVLSLHNFSKFVDNFDNFHIVTNYRTDLSKDLYSYIESQSNFSFIRETADEFIYALNREQTAISVWKVLEASASFAKEMIKIIEKLNIKYNIDSIEPQIMLFKCKEPNWYIPQNKMATIDWENDVMINAQLFNKYGRLNAINYSTQKKEMKAPNTSLLKSLKTPNGDPFDLFVVV